MPYAEYCGCSRHLFGLNMTRTKTSVVPSAVKCNSSNVLLSSKKKCTILSSFKPNSPVPVLKWSCFPSSLSFPLFPSVPLFPLFPSVPSFPSPTSTTTTSTSPPSTTDSILVSTTVPSPSPRLAALPCPLTTSAVFSNWPMI